MTHKKAKKMLMHLGYSRNEAEQLLKQSSPEKSNYSVYISCLFEDIILVSVSI